MDKNMQALAIIISFVGLITVPFIVHFLSQKRDRENREYNKRADTRKRQIQAAREYVDKWSNLIFIVGEMNNKVLQSNSVNDMLQTLDRESFSRLTFLMEEVNKQVDSLHILNDEELLIWHSKFLPSLLPMIKYQMEVLDNAAKNNNFSIDKNRLKVLSKACIDCTVVFARMKYKLDELEQTLK